MKRSRCVEALPFRLPPYPHFQKALAALLEAFDDAADTTQPVWEYAVELGDLHDQGTPTCALRWLMDKGVIEHAYEQKGKSRQRRFRKVISHVFNVTSCFVLVAPAVPTVRQALQGAISTDHQKAEDRAATSNGQLFGIPFWNREEGELWYENDLVLVRTPKALNQRKLLDHCQNNQWRQPLESPFKIYPDKDDYEPDTLHNTLARLNEGATYPSHTVLPRRIRQEISLEPNRHQRNQT